MINVGLVLRKALRTLEGQRKHIDKQVKQVEKALGRTGKRHIKAATRRILSQKMKERWAAAEQRRKRKTAA